MWRRMGRKPTDSGRIFRRWKCATNGRSAPLQGAKQPCSIAYRTGKLAAPSGSLRKTWLGTSLILAKRTDWNASGANDPERPRDPKLAKSIIDIATGQTPDRDPDEGKDPAALALGRKGGLKGAARAASMMQRSNRRRPWEVGTVTLL
jgi:hypothetical protein